MTSSVLVCLLILLILLFKTKKMDSSSVYWLKIMVGIGVVVGAIIYLIIYVLEQADLKKEERKSSLSGELKPKQIIKPSGSDLVSIKCGTIGLATQRQELIDGFVFNPLKMI